MRYAIISDIHGNLEALNKVLHQINTLNIDSVICLGDIVGYGPFPDECCISVETQCSRVIAGNHDFAAVDFLNTAGFSTYAAQMIDWTKLQLSWLSVKFLSHLPLTAKFDNFFCVHGSPLMPDRFMYVIAKQDAKIALEETEEQVCFVGHSHIPFIYEENGAFGYQLSCELQDDKRYVINVGSVGQPRDRDPRSCFGVLDTNKGLFEFIRTDYDIKKTQAAMQAQNLPEFLIARLAKGR